MSDQPPSIFSKGASGLSIFSNFGKTDGKKDEEKKQNKPDQQFQQFSGGNTIFNFSSSQNSDPKNQSSGTNQEQKASPLFQFNSTKPEDKNNESIKKQKVFEKPQTQKQSKNSQESGTEAKTSQLFSFAQNLDKQKSEGKQVNLNNPLSKQIGDSSQKNQQKDKNEKKVEQKVSQSFDKKQEKVADDELIFGTQKKIQPPLFTKEGQKQKKIVQQVSKQTDKAVSGLGLSGLSSGMSFNESSKKQNQKFMPLRKIHQIFSEQKKEKRSLINQRKDELILSFKSSLPYVFQDEGSFEEKLSENADYNKFLKSFGKYFLRLLDLNQKKLGTITSNFKFWLQMNNHEQAIFHNGTLNHTLLVNLNIYTQLHSGQYQINQDEESVNKMVAQFCQYYFNELDYCITKLYDWPDLIKTTKIFEYIWQSTIGLNCVSHKREKNLKNIKIHVMKEKLKLCQKVNKFLSYMHDKYSESYPLIKDIKSIIKYLTIIDLFQEQSSIQLIQKILLPFFCKIKKRDVSRELLNATQRTKSLGLLPFRIVIHQIDPKRSEKKPYIADLYKFVKSQEWTDWLALNLSGENANLHIHQKQTIVQIIKSLNINIGKCLSNQIYGKRHPILQFIIELKQDNLIDLYFQALSSCLHDVDSVIEMEKYFLKKDAFKMDFQSLVEDVKRYPNNDPFNEQFDRQFKAKAIFLLKYLALVPEQSFQLQNIFFDIYGFMDNQNYRCDRICHLIIDFIGYFGARKNSQILIGEVFQTITFFLRKQATRPCMILALNANKPAAMNFSQNLSPELSNSLSIFIKEVFKEKQFFQFLLDKQENKFTLASLYIDRYSSEEYDQVNRNQRYFVPFFWISHALKAVRMQEYNPEILELLLNRLNLNPSQTITVERPAVFEAIVETLNGYNFWKPFMQCLQPVISYKNGKINIINQNLLQNYSYNLLHILHSLRLLRTMLKLHKILRDNQQKYPRHPFIILLTNLKCINDVSKFLLGSTEKHLGETKLVPVMSLFALLKINFGCKNVSETYEQYKFEFQESHNKIFREYESLYPSLFQIDRIDYDVIKNFLNKQNNKQLECFQNLASVSFQCLTLIFTLNKNLSLDNTLFSALPKKQSRIANEFKIFQQKIYSYIIKGLMDEETQVSRCAWTFLLSLRQSERNDDSSRQLFQMYSMRSKRLAQSPSIIQYIVRFIDLQISSDANFYEKTIDELISIIGNKELEMLPVLLNFYKSINFDGSIYYEMLRYRLEKKLVQMCQVYISMNITINLISKQLFKNKTGLQQKISHLVRIITEHKILTLPTYSINSVSSDTYSFKKDVFPRQCGYDSTQLLLNSNRDSLKNALINQVSNVLNWCYIISNQLLRSTQSFIIILLSIDETYYSNHPIKIESKIYPNLFCNLHLGIVPYQALDLMGRSNNESITNIKTFIDSILDKIEEVKYDKQIKDQFSLDKAFQIINASLSWLNSRKKILKSFESKVLCKKVLMICFPYLGQPLYDPEGIRLLLTIVNITNNTQLSSESIYNIRQTVLQTLESKANLQSELKQQLISILIVIPPTDVEKRLIQSVAKIWMDEEFDVYFYNESRVVLRLCQKHPLIMCHNNLLSNCRKIQKLNEFQKGNRYVQGMRRGDGLCWIWILKICVALLENSQSTIVLHEVGSFVKKNKSRIFQTISEIRNKNQQTKKRNEQYDEKIIVNYAEIQQLEATLQVLVCLFKSQTWVAVNRQLFEQLLYTLLHETLSLFTSTDRKGGLYKKTYLPVSDNQKILWNMKTHKKVYGDIQNKEMEEQFDSFYEKNNDQPNMLVLALHFRFQTCFQVWCLACSSGLKASWMVQSYFYKPIPTLEKGPVLKYNLTYWQHLNKVVIGMLNIEVGRILEWSRWNNKRYMLQMLNDSFNSTQIFVQSGYLTSLLSIPSSEEEIINQLTNSITLCLQFGICHLVSQMRFQKKHGIITKTQIVKFKDNLVKYAQSAQNSITKWDVRLSTQQQNINNYIRIIQKIQL